MMNKRLILFFVFIFLFSFRVLALAGVSPSSYSFDFQPGLEKEFYFDFYGDEGKNYEVYTQGELSKYITLKTKSLEGSGRVFFKLSLPDKIDTPGSHVIFVGARQVPKEGQENEGFSLVSNIKGVVNLRVPYPESYLSVEFIAPSVRSGEPVKFNAKISNQGLKGVDFSSNVKIFDSSNNLVETLILDNGFIDGLGRQSLDYLWNTKEVSPGRYVAQFNLDYLENHIEINKTFRLGELYVNLLNYSNDFERDKINKIDLEVESYWNDPIESVFAEVYLPDYNINFLTPSIKLQGFEKSFLSGYFDTTGIVEDEFRGVIKLHYSDKSQEFPINLRFRKEPNYVIYGIIAVGLLIVILIFVLLWLRRTKLKGVKKNEKK